MAVILERHAATSNPHTSAGELTMRTSLISYYSSCVPVRTSRRTTIERTSYLNNFITPTYILKNNQMRETYRVLMVYLGILNPNPRSNPTTARSTAPSPLTTKTETNKTVT